MIRLVLLLLLQIGNPMPVEEALKKFDAYIEGLRRTPSMDTMPDGFSADDSHSEDSEDTPIPCHTRKDL